MIVSQAKKPQFSILLLLVSFASVGAVLFTPSLPLITSFFGITVGEAQLTITTYLIGYALGQLPYGPLANRFGRKKTLYLGLSLAICGSLLCALSSFFGSFTALALARFLQAFGACVGMKISFTMIADVCDQNSATKMISRFIIAFAIMPGIAMAIGGWLTRFLGWESCFYFLVLFGVVVLWLSTYLPETSKALDRQALQLSSIIKGYRLEFKNQQLLYSALIMGCGSAVIYIYASKAPFIGINLIGLAPEVFGTYNLIPLLGMLIGALLSEKAVGRFPVFKIMLMAIFSCLGFILTQLIPFSFGIFTPLTLFFPMLLIYLGESFVFANASSFGLTNAKNKSNGSAVLNFINLVTTVVAVLLAETIYPDSALLMPWSFFILMSCSLLLLWRLNRLKS